MRKKINKYGLTGNSGFGSGLVINGQTVFHAGMPYDSNGKVFVEWEYREKLPNGKIDKWERWKRMTLKRALREKRKIIPCSKCKNPAVMIDHIWPGYNDFNLCDKHAKKRKTFRGE